jgi:hypothetical protein
LWCIITKAGLTGKFCSADDGLKVKAFVSRLQQAKLVAKNNELFFSVAKAPNSFWINYLPVRTNDVLNLPLCLS